ncbi:MAG TPA: alpha/beta hydrolase [Solirubrobacteraceae bacterium]|nr:alpha/beta hydrolase [Solirubrobacteraceae bacterium]
MGETPRFSAGNRLELRRGPVTLSCLDFGGSGPAALLLHGLAGHAGEWRATASWLTERRRVIALDVRGHGHSTTDPDDVSPDAHAEDVACVVERLAGGGPVSLIGQSLGANLAFLVASRRPDLVRELVVAEGYPNADPRREASASIERWLGSWPLPFASRADAVAFFGGGPRGEAWADGLVRDPGGLDRRFRADLLVRTLAEALAVDRWAEWEGVAARALVVRGSEGQFTEEAMRTMVRRARDARYAEIAGAGHEVHLERPRAWREVLERFLLTGDVESSNIQQSS